MKFTFWQTVRVIDGVFTGVVGKVARYHGQQRVAIIIVGLLTTVSAYVPSAFWKKHKYEFKGNNQLFQKVIFATLYGTDIYFDSL